MCYSTLILLFLIIFFVTTNSKKIISIISDFLRLSIAHAPSFDTKIRLTLLLHLIDFVFTCLRLFQKGTPSLTGPLKITWKISQDLLMSLAVNILLRSDFGSKFLSFTKPTRRKSVTFSILRFNTLFFIFTLNVIRRWSLVLHSILNFISVIKTLRLVQDLENYCLSLDY